MRYLTAVLINTTKMFAGFAIWTVRTATFSICAFRLLIHSPWVSSKITFTGLIRYHWTRLVI